jgi:hypothetical protein
VRKRIPILQDFAQAEIQALNHIGRVNGLANFGIKKMTQRSGDGA